MVVVITSVDATVIDRGRAAVAPALSATCNVKSVVFSSVGVPEMVPVLEFMLRPTGRVPAAMDQTNGAVPPLATGVWEYGVPEVPPGSAVVVSVRAGDIVGVYA